MKLFVRSLVLCNAFLLVLPQGWCCFLPVPNDSLGQTPAKAAERCSCTNPAKQKPATPAPQPANPSKTCCYCQPANITVPSSEKVQVDVGIGIPFVVSTCHAAPSNAMVLTICGYRPHSPPLQLLHCIWLC